MGEPEEQRAGHEFEANGDAESEELRDAVSRRTLSENANSGGTQCRGECGRRRRVQSATKRGCEVNANALERVEEWKDVVSMSRANCYSSRRRAPFLCIVRISQIVEAS